MRSDRDDGLDRAMRRALQDSGTDCPDVNDLAAYAERTLSGPERRGVEGHLSRCARCRETLLLMEKGTAPVLPATKKGGSPLYWLVGAAAAGLATVLWIAQPDRKPPTAGVSTAPQSAQKFDPATPPPLPQEAPGSFADKVVEPPATRAIPESTARERNRAADAGAKRSRDERKQEEAARGRFEAERPVAEPAPAAPPPPVARPTTAAPPPPAPTPAPETMTQGSARAKVAEKDGDRQMIARQDRRFREVPDSIVASSTTAANKLAAADASSASVWRVWASGKVERSSDGAATWVPEPSVVAPAARAIHAPSADVCWIVGDAGLILRYERTRGWIRLSPPAQVAFVGVEALDALRATITAADGRRFTTTDGTTWK